ncbi:hypothetical protein ASF08_12820 [Methylobacterium sp. Leaf85]|nr:hypothetical protein ASF08_12820 [Methylobacterium sp. Leaf85]
MDAGKACAAYHDEHVRNVQARQALINKSWSFTYAKKKNVVAAVVALGGTGDTWTWPAIDADSKLVLSYLIGGRDRMSVQLSSFQNC